MEFVEENKDKRFCEPIWIWEKSEIKREEIKRSIKTFRPIKFEVKDGTLESGKR